MTTSFARAALARVLTALIAIPVVAYLALLAYLYFFQRQLLYFPDRSRPQLGELAAVGVREVQLTTADGLTCSSWYLPPREGRPVIAYFHGNGGNIAYRADRVQRFAREGYGVLMIEYRGYGGNPGAPSEAGLFADARRRRWIFCAPRASPPSGLVLYGELLGIGGGRARGGAAGRARPWSSNSPFTSIAAVAQYHYPFVPAALLVRDRFDSLSRIGKVKAPMLVLQGERDGIVPTRFGEALFAAAPEPKERWVAPQAGHEDLAGFGALDAVVAFIERHVAEPHESSLRGAGRRSLHEIASLRSQ